MLTELICKRGNSKSGQRCKSREAERLKGQRELLYRKVGQLQVEKEDGPKGLVLQCYCAVLNS